MSRLPWILRLLLASGPLWIGLARAPAEPLEELRAASSLGTVEARQLTGGGIVSARGPVGNFARGVYVEAAYFIKAPAPAVSGMLLHWDPARVKGTEVSAYRTYHEPATDVFGAFRLTGAHAADRWLLDATVDAAGGNPGELHLAPGDAVFLREDAGRVLSPAQREERCNVIWQRILRSRSEAMAAGGLAAVPAYSAGGVNIAAATEFKSLLRMTPAISAHFTPVTELRPLNPAAAGGETAAYAEQSLVRGHTSYCLGNLVARPTAAGAWQVADCTYYAVDTYFMSVALYQLWPWENGTLVWQVDYASAPFRAYTGGLDKVLAGREMLKDGAQGIRLFRREVERAQKTAGAKPAPLVNPASSAAGSSRP